MLRSQLPCSRAVQSTPITARPRAGIGRRDLTSSLEAVTPAPRPHLILAIRQLSDHEGLRHAGHSGRAEPNVSSLPGGSCCSGPLRECAERIERMCVAAASSTGCSHAQRRRSPPPYAPSTVQQCCPHCCCLCGGLAILHFCKVVVEHMCDAWARASRMYGGRQRRECAYSERREQLIATWQDEEQVHGTKI